MVTTRSPANYFLIPISRTTLVRESPQRHTSRTNYLNSYHKLNLTSYHEPRESSSNDLVLWNYFVMQLFLLSFPCSMYLPSISRTIFYQSTCTLSSKTFYPMLRIVYDTINCQTPSILTSPENQPANLLVSPPLLRASLDSTTPRQSHLFSSVILCDVFDSRYKEAFNKQNIVLVILWV